MLGTMNVQIEKDTFEPGIFSLPELHFLLEHLKDAPIVAFHDFDPDTNKAHKGVIRVRAETALTRFYELAELEKHRQSAWAGYDALEDSIMRYLAWHERSMEIKRRGGPATPSQYHWDETGQPYKYAIGSDSGEMVRTEILDDGSRKPFAVRLTLTPAEMMASDLSDVAPWIKPKGEAYKLDTVEVAVKGRMGTMRCSICGKVEEFDSADRQKRMAARARMGRHLKNARQELNRHRLLLRKEFK